MNLWLQSSLSCLVCPVHKIPFLSVSYDPREQNDDKAWSTVGFGFTYNSFGGANYSSWDETEEEEES